MNPVRDVSPRQRTAEKVPPPTAPCKDTHLHRRFMAWPGTDLLLYFALWGLAQAIWFALIYGGADYITSLRSYRVRIHFERELGIPFYPSMVVFYMSLYLLFLISPFVLRTRVELRALAYTFFATTFVAGVFFLAIPAELAYSQPTRMGSWTQLFHLADSLNLHYNLLPSLHVTFAVVCAGAFATRASSIGKFGLWSWAAAVGASTILTHQHHLIDVPAGFLLGLAGIHFVFNRHSTLENGS